MIHLTMILSSSAVALFDRVPTHPLEYRLDLGDLFPGKQDSALELREMSRSGHPVQLNRFREPPPTTTSQLGHVGLRQALDGSGLLVGVRLR